MSSGGGGEDSLGGGTLCSGIQGSGNMLVSGGGDLGGGGRTIIGQHQQVVCTSSSRWSSRAPRYFVCSSTAGNQGFNRRLMSIGNGSDPLNYGKQIIEALFQWMG